jgi:hypothetical protein
MLVLFSSRVFAQGVPEGQPLPMPPIANAPLEAQQPAPPPPDERSWSERCFARTQPGWYGTVYWWPRPVVVLGVGPGPRGRGLSSGGPVHGARPVGGAQGGGGGGGDAAVVLVVLAVVVAAALPFIFYALDEDATPDVEGRFHCPGVDLDVRGGVEGDASAGLSSLLGVRLRATAGWFGVLVQADLAPWSDPRPMLDTRLAALVRFTPKQHVELGLSVGYRSQVLRGSWRPGLEVAIPHEYVFWRDGAAQVGLEVRPSLFWWGSIDLALDVGLRVPLGPLVSLQVGGRVFTVDGLNMVGAGAQAGVGFKL